MRIDKYLWCTRYFKTRNKATEACRKGLVRINGDTCKPSREVLPSDKITLRKNQLEMQLTVLDIPPQRVGAKWVGIYRQDTTPAEDLEQHKLIRATKEYYRKKGTGRPTKKDRRDLEAYREDPDDDWDPDAKTP
ncbi:RNA-binding S4 domain-containing protein [Robiginitalea biformata]|uniref:Heat shock protein 15 n=1 Tax=Robiginitalea biformata (strain ATCC BAA-864 / DSM 15991 / KCTC 12146 / HTCC2501) TaxID=313596 RepID=A4CN73_ROBBH|nr:S4 domain-containing protein [Robiginitalea biformata]EAR15115.1 heat shock protein 15 [Robiginitalea biformata HTCC2501]